MKNKSTDFKQRNRNPKFSILWVMFGMLILLIIGFSTQLYHADHTFKNLRVSIDDYSWNQEAPSLRLRIDDSLYYQTEKMEKSSDTLLTKLESGVHKVEVSTLDGLYTITDTITIKKIKDAYCLSIDYKSSDIEKRNMFKRNFKPNIQGIQDSTEIREIRKKLIEIIDKRFDSLQKNTYFTFSFINFSEGIIE